MEWPAPGQTFGHKVRTFAPPHTLRFEAVEDAGPATGDLSDSQPSSPFDSPEFGHAIESAVHRSLGSMFEGGDYYEDEPADWRDVVVDPTDDGLTS